MTARQWSGSVERHLLARRREHQGVSAVSWTTEHVATAAPVAVGWFTEPPAATTVPRPGWFVPVAPGGGGLPYTLPFILGAGAGAELPFMLPAVVGG
jgi:hypothetical protein